MSKPIPSHMSKTPLLELFSLGTPVMDGFAQVGADFLSAHKLALGSSNFMDNARLAQLEKDVGPRIRSWDPGDNGRNVCESFARLQQDETFARLRQDERQKEIGVAEEIIIALNPNTYGDLNTSVIVKELGGTAKKISRLGRGIPTGGEIEFADEETLGQALERRN